MLNMVVLGCGKKAPPVPPQRHRPPAVTDLSYRLSGGNVSLNWTVPDMKITNAAEIKGCIVYRARTQSGCPGCPLKFDAVADLPLETTGRKNQRLQTMRYSEPLDRGYRYTYKVQCYTAKGGSGRDSNTVVFNY